MTDALAKILLLLTLLSCQEKEFTKDPAESFKIAREPYDDGDYEIAVTKLGEFVSRFPYSQYAVEAELFVANSQFELEQFEEAASAYAQFVKLHPKHAEIGFAMFRVGESYWSLAPEAIDREQEYTIKAIEEWKKLVEKLPESSYAKQAEKLLLEGEERIAKSYEFVVDFYCKLEKYAACAFRAIELLEKYPQFKDLRLKALEKASSSLRIIAKEKDADPKSDKNIYFEKMTADQIREYADRLEKQLKSSKVN